MWDTGGLVYTPHPLSSGWSCEEKTEEGAGSPVVPFLRTALPSFRRHGGMDHPGAAAGGGRPAALHHDREVRLELSSRCVQVLIYPHLKFAVPVS